METVHEDLLLWSAGRDSAPSALAGDEWPAVFERIKAHRLTTRLHARLLRERPVWVTDHMAAQVHSEAKRCATVKDTYVEQVRRLDELLFEADVPPITAVKGASAWAHTGHDYQIVTTSDIDAVATDLHAAETALLQAGYRPLVDRMPHEFAKLVPADPHWEVELHSYFPVWRYGPPLRPSPWAEPPLRANSLSIDCSSALAQDRLGVHAVNVYGTQYGRVLAPDLTDCVLIRCAHVMHDYAEPPYYLAGDKLRLFEIAEIRELSAEQGFDRERFEQSVRDLNADACIGLINQIFDLVYGEPFLADAHADVSAYLPPLELCWGIDVQPARTARQLLETDATFDELFKVEPPTEITLRVNDDPQRWTTRSGTSARRFGRVLINWSELRETEFDLAVSVDEEALRFEFTIDGPPGQFLEELEVIFPTTRLYTAYEVSRDSYRLPDQATWGSVGWTVGAEGCRVDIAIPVDTVRRLAAQIDGVLSLVLAVERFQSIVGEDWNEFFAENMVSCAVPMRILFVADDPDSAVPRRHRGE